MQRQRDGRPMLALVYANVVGAILTLLAKWLAGGAGGELYSLSVTVFIPLIMGFVQGFAWGDRQMPRGAFTRETLLLTTLGMLEAAIALGEGSVCLIMAFPLIWGLIALGAWLGQPFATRGPRKLSVSFVPLVLIGMIADPHRHADWQGKVTTTMQVNAPPAAVSPHIVAFPRIAAPSDFWLCRAGLPFPVETVADGPWVGARRECRFSGPITIGEKITAIAPGKSVTFAITEQPAYPEITHHAILQRGHIEIRDNGDGTSTLIGTSWYRLNVSPALYFHFWADHVIHGVHERVFDHIERLATKR